MSVRDVAVRYFSCINAHDAEGLSRLFAEDGWLRPAGAVKIEMHGRQAIREFYSKLFARTPDLSIDPEDRMIVDGNICVARFSSLVHGQRIEGFIDIFTVNEHDELVEMTAYSRPRS